jgi:DNA-binding response OmpR family regulator
MLRGGEPAVPFGARQGLPCATSTSDPIPVLLVDDDAEFRADVHRALTRAGFQAFVAATSTQAWDFLAHRAPFERAPAPAFVVLDFKLPDFDAPALLARMRAAVPPLDVPVIVVSQTASPADERAAMTAGARAYRAKPSRLGDLETMLLDFWREVGEPRGHPDR